MLIAKYLNLKWQYILDNGHWSFNDVLELDLNTFRRNLVLFFIFKTFSARAILVYFLTVGYPPKMKHVQSDIWNCAHA